MTETPDTTETPEPIAEPIEAPAGTTIQTFTTERDETWHLIEAGSWQVSVAPDGLVMLPRHLHPTEVEDFCAAARAGAQVAAIVVRNNDAKTTAPPTPEELAKVGTVIITERGAEPPKGAVQMPISEMPVASIGRPKRTDPRAPRPAAKKPIPPRAGARRGQNP